MSKLKPCPFCGKKPEVIRQKFTYSDLFGVSCADFFFDCRADSEAEAIAAWNRRTPAPEVEALREALEQLSRYSGDEAPNWVRMIARNAISLPAAPVAENPYIPDAKNCGPCLSGRKCPYHGAEKPCEECAPYAQFYGRTGLVPECCTDDSEASPCPKCRPAPAKEGEKPCK